MNAKRVALATLVLGLTLGLMPSGTSQAEAGLFGPPCVTCYKPCPPPVEVVLNYCHPCTGCKYCIPVCIPACCEGAPNVCFKPTIFGNGKVVFTWCCGHTVVVRFGHCGDYRVITR